CSIGVTHAHRCARAHLAKRRCASWTLSLTFQRQDYALRKEAENSAFPRRAYYILDELLIAGEMQESSKKSVLRAIAQQDALEDNESGERSWADRAKV
ncbi:MAG: hypothetical protein BJ554DRAFT_7056, partial [Olpidium bornovanus]